VKRTTRVPLLPRIKMSGATPLLPLPSQRAQGHVYVLPVSLPYGCVPYLMPLLCESRTRGYG
jgi:hypothetical protein